MTVPPTIKALGADDDNDDFLGDPCDGGEEEILFDDPDKGEGEVVEDDEDDGEEDENDEVQVVI